MTEAVDRWLSRSRIRLLGSLIFLVALVTWLFSQATGTSPQAHYDYLQSLRRIQQSDVALNAAVLASHSKIIRNYDLVMGYTAEIRQDRAHLSNLPQGLPTEFSTRLVERSEALIASQIEKENDVDRFQRLNSIVGNSGFYLSTLADELEDDPVFQVSRDYGKFVRHVLAYSQGVESLNPDAVRGELEVVQKLAPKTAQGKRALRQLVLHAEILIHEAPELNALVKRILSARTTAILDEVTSIYIEGREAELRAATYYRICLYAVSLLLALYLVRSLLRLESGRQRLEVAHHNLEERYEAQRRAEGELRLYGTVFTNAREGMTITDVNTRIIAVNPAFTEITGYTLDEVVGQTPSILNSGRQGGEFYRRMWQELQQKGRWHGEIWNRRKDGKVFPEWLSIVGVKGENAEITHYIGVFTDVSEHKRNEARISHLASHDILTGLPNRVLLEDRISDGMKLSKRRGSTMALLFIDLDRFKNINDTLGHETGDQLLVQAAERGLAVLRKGDTLSRIGGDEFVAVLPELDNRQIAADTALKLLAELCLPYQLAGHELTVSGSVGIALYPEDGHTVSDLLRKADAAMYRAKEEGRNTFRYFSAEVARASLDELLLEQELRGALERDELEMYYEPKIDARSGRIVAAEALMRWKHREKGMVSPAIFIPLAEKIGLIHLLGEWALRDVCRQLRAWREVGLLPVPVAVNISAQQFAHQDLPALIKETLASEGLGAELLTLELTESLLMRDTQRASEVLAQLRALHIKVAIDDFGVGYSSLSYLKQFPVDALKIDRSFVCEIDAEGERVKLAAAIIAMAHELDLLVIGEGVENEIQRDYLLAHGCDQFQGYFFGRAQPAEDFGRLLETAVVRQ